MYNIRRQECFTRHSKSSLVLDALEKLLRRELALAFDQQHRLSVGKAR